MSGVNSHGGVLPHLFLDVASVHHSDSPPPSYHTRIESEAYFCTISSSNSNHPINSPVTCPAKPVLMTPPSVDSWFRTVNSTPEMQNPSCLLYGPGDARFEDRPLPIIEDPYDVIIRIAYVGVCGSDVRISLALISRKKPTTNDWSTGLGAFLVSRRRQAVCLSFKPPSHGPRGFRNRAHGRTCRLNPATR
jgi:hypothetical protein